MLLLPLPAIEELNGTELSRKHTRERPWALVLAGGDGRRLQALTRKIAGAPIPKQYCRIMGDRSLLEVTLGRILPLVPRERTLVVVNRSLELALPQLRDVPPGNVIVQPGNRDTGPGVVFGLLDLTARRPRAPVAVFPSDHYVDDGSSFREHVERATFLVDRFPTKIALLGISPDSPRARIRLHRARPAARRARSRIAPGVPGCSLPREAIDRAGEAHLLLVVPVDGVSWSDWGTPEAVEQTLAALQLQGADRHLANSARMQSAE